MAELVLVGLAPAPAPGQQQQEEEEGARSVNRDTLHLTSVAIVEGTPYHSVQLVDVQSDSSKLRSPCQLLCHLVQPMNM